VLIRQGYVAHRLNREPARLRTPTISPQGTECYNDLVRRFALAVLVALLTLSASGVTRLVVPEPCGSNEPARNDNACPPTCVTCGCCALAAEPVILTLSSSADVRVTDVVVPLPQLPTTDPRDILHVPKPRLA
jgi:hypothetical protein